MQDVQIPILSHIVKDMEKTMQVNIIIVIVEHGRMRDVLRSLVESIALICMEINANVK